MRSDRFGYGEEIVVHRLHEMPHVEQIRDTAMDDGGAHHHAGSAALLDGDGALHDVHDAINDHRDVLGVVADHDDLQERLWRQLGDGIWDDREPLKTGHRPDTYAPELPSDIAAATTGLPCIDAFAAELIGSGWLHNHARMWLASYVVHWRRVRWQVGARWFLRHLLDGDPASNNLSWQWVASSVSHKPYIFNRVNLERFSSGRYCGDCPRAGRGGAAGCPFEASYEDLQTRLFLPLAGQKEGRMPEQSPPQPALAAAAEPASPVTSLRRPLVWVHEEALGAANPALLAHPDAPAVAVLDAVPVAAAIAAGRGE